MGATAVPTVAFVFCFVFYFGFPFLILLLREDLIKTVLKFALAKDDLELQFLLP